MQVLYVRFKNFNVNLKVNDPVLILDYRLLEYRVIARSWRGSSLRDIIAIYVIEAIVDSRVPSGGTSIEYKVKWRGWQGQDTWEPVSNIRGRL